MNSTKQVWISPSSNFLIKIEVTATDNGVIKASWRFIVRLLEIPKRGGKIM
jgi:hypothetical protein